MWELSQNIGYENKMIGVSLGIACAHLIEYERGTQQEFNLKVCVAFYLLSLCSRQIKGISNTQTEKQIRYSWNRVFNLKSKMYWVSVVLNQNQDQAQVFKTNNFWTISRYLFKKT